MVPVRDYRRSLKFDRLVQSPTEQKETKKTKRIEQKDTERRSRNHKDAVSRISTSGYWRRCLNRRGFRERAGGGGVATPSWDAQWLLNEELKWLKDRSESVTSIL
jgi:hypothetical protein